MTLPAPPAMYEESSYITREAPFSWEGNSGIAMRADLPKVTWLGSSLSGHDADVGFKACAVNPTTKIHFYLYSFIHSFIQPKTLEDLLSAESSA